MTQETFQRACDIEARLTKLVEFRRWLNEEVFKPCIDIGNEIYVTLSQDMIQALLKCCDDEEKKLEQEFEKL